MTGLLATENTTDPGDDLVRGGVRGLVEVDDTELDVAREVTLEGGGTGRDGGEVSACEGESNVS